MPGGDPMGPRGEGFGTGRGWGYCAGAPRPGSATADSRGVGSRGRGRGWRAGGERALWGRGRHGHRHRNLFRATGLTGRERQAAAAAADDETRLISADAVAVLQKLTRELALSLQQLQGRLDALEGKPVADGGRPSVDA